MRPPRLIGRADEADALVRAWAEQRAFVLLGEGGIGKTRLLQDFAAAPGLVLTVAARPGDRGIPYAVLARLLRAVRPHGPQPVDASRREALALVLPELGPAAPLAG